MLQRVEAAINQLRARSRRTSSPARAAAAASDLAGGGNVNRGQLQILLKPKDERTRSSDQIAQELRRQLSGIPGVIVRASASGGNNQLNRFLSGGNNGGGRLSLEIRGDNLDDARKVAQAAKDLLDTVPNLADARLGRDEGRPELAVRGRPPEGGPARRERGHRGEHAAHQRGRHAGGPVPPGRPGIPDRRPPAGKTSGRP